MRSTLLLRGAMLAASVVCFGSVRAADPPKGFTAVFNGTDLTGWHGWAIHDKGGGPYDLAKLTPEQRQEKIDAWSADAKKHWSVENGELVNDGHGAYLATDKDYGDIEFYIEYKTVPLADSGIYLRATPQVQIWDYRKEGGKWNIGADKGSGGLWNNSAGAPGKDPLVLADKPFGEWNKFHIIQVGARTTVWLNDKLVVDNARMENFWDRKKPLLRQAPILLQTHGGEIRWRNIFIREIPSEEANALLKGESIAGSTPSAPPQLAQFASWQYSYPATCGCCRPRRFRVLLRRRADCPMVNCQSSPIVNWHSEPRTDAPPPAVAKRDDGFESVFNGRDFDGWAGPVENYEVKDGAIVCKPHKGGTIYTKEEYSDFVARVEFKLPPGGNNGLAIRYPGQGDTAYVGMCEVQVLDDTAKQYAKLDPRQYNGSVYGIVASQRGYLRPVGEWNFEEVTVKGSHIKVELNGTVIVDADVSKVTQYMANSAHPGKDRTSGHFGFAGHNDPVSFRTVMIKKLSEK